MKAKLFLLAILFPMGCWAQTIFSENMGTPSGTTSISANAFQNNTLTFSSGSQSNPADVRSTNASSSYSNASGGGNIYFTSTSGTYGFAIENISASNYNTISLQFGYKKESVSVHAVLSVEYWNGSAWTVLANSSSALFNETNTAPAVWYLSKTLSLPSDAQINGLKIRFVKTGTTAIRIDDVKLKGAENLPSITNTTVTNIAANSATFGGEVLSTAGATIIATGTVYSATLVNSNPLLGGLSVVNLTTPSPNNGTGTFSNNSGSNLLPNVQYSYNSYATKDNGISGYGTISEFYSLAVTPSAPTISSPTGSSLNINLGSDSNSSTTLYSIWETTTGNYVQANGTLGVSAIYQTATEWATKTVTGLSQSTSYTFCVVAKNGSGILTTASASASSATLTLPTISTSGSLSSLNTIYGTESPSINFTFSGSNLTHDILISAPTGFEISITSGGVSGYATSQTLSPISGAISATIVYVRLASNTQSGIYSGNISLYSNGLTVNVPTVSSTVSKKTVAITGVTALNKAYNGNTMALLTAGPVLDGILATDTSNVTLVTGYAANFSDASIGTNKSVTVTGYTITGSASNNYSLQQPVGLTADITPNISSDIELNSSSSTNSNENIDYTLYQGTTLTNTGTGINGSVGIVGFHLRDGGAGLNDADDLPTELTGMTVHLINPANIRYIRLFAGNSPRSLPIAVNGASVIQFNGLTNVIAWDDTQLALNLRITFNSTVTDNQHVGVIINGVTANENGSRFNSFNGGGVNSITTGDINRIEVNASKLAFLQQPAINSDEKTNMTPSPSVQAIDDYNNRDLDFSNEIAIVSSGTLLVSPQTAIAVQGYAIFENINHDVSGSGLILTASSNGFNNIQSTSFNVLGVPKFDEYGIYVQGAFVPTLPTTSLNGIVGIWSPSINNMQTTTYTFTPNVGQNATNTTLSIQIVESPYSDNEVLLNPPPFNQSCIVDGVNVNLVAPSRINYVPPTHPSNNFCSPATIHNPVASTLYGNHSLIFNFNVPITSIKVPIYVFDNYYYPGGLHAADGAIITINSPGQLSLTNLCGVSASGNIITCTLPVQPLGVRNSGNVSVTISSTIPFTTLTLGLYGESGFCSHPCDVSDIITCLAGTNAPSLTATNLSNVCPNTGVNLSGIVATNQPANTTLTWHTTTPANGSSLVANPSSAGAGTYYAAFYDSIHNCYSPTSVAVNISLNTCVADLSIAKSVSNGNPSHNSNVTFTITANNNGSSPATGVIVTDNLPSGYTFVSANTSAGTWSTPNWSVGNLANGASETLTITAKVVCGSYSNAATITGNQTDPNMSNNSATASVSPLIILNAVNDNFTDNPIIVCAGGQTPSVFTNDLLTCSTVSSATVSTTLINNGGISGASINSSTGMISIPANTFPGTYFLTYKICEITNLSNCDTANALITVTSTVNAQDDDFSSVPINGLTGGVTTSIFSNDFLNGLAINPSDITLSYLPPLSAPGITIDSSGLVHIPANTAVGTYTITYQITDNTCSINSDMANITIEVTPPFITTPNISNSIRANNQVENIALQSDGKILITGHFSTYNNIAKKFFARLNTDLTLDNSFLGLTSSVTINGVQLYDNAADIKVQTDDKIIVVSASPFSFGGGSAIARLNADGSYDSTFVTGSGISANGFSSHIASCAIQQDGKILIGGYFLNYNGTPVNSMIRLNTNGSIDSTFTFPYPGVQIIHRVVIQSDGKILISGLLNASPTVPGIIRRHLIRLDSDGSVDQSFNQGEIGNLDDYHPNDYCSNCGSNHIQKILVHPADGSIYIAGAFDNYSGSLKNCVVKLNPDGTINQNFNTNIANNGTDRGILDLDLENPNNPLSNVIFCGEFTTYNGNSVKKMARFRFDGSYDPSFSIGSGTLDSTGSDVTHNIIMEMQRQSDGKVIVGGRFTSFNGITAGNITRIYGSSGLQTKSPINVYTSETEIDTNPTLGNIKVYPNPSSGLFIIDLTQEDLNYNQVKVYNVLGMEVYNSTVISKEINQLDISSLPSGYYIAKITSESSCVQLNLLKK